MEVFLKVMNGLVMTLEEDKSVFVVLQRMQVMQISGPVFCSLAGQMNKNFAKVQISPRIGWL